MQSLSPRITVITAFDLQDLAFCCHIPIIPDDERFVPGAGNDGALVWEPFFGIHVIEL